MAQLTSFVRLNTFQLLIAELFAYLLNFSSIDWPSIRGNINFYELKYKLKFADTALLSADKIEAFLKRICALQKDIETDLIDLPIFVSLYRWCKCQIVLFADFERNRPREMTKTRQDKKPSIKVRIKNIMNHQIYLDEQDNAAARSQFYMTAASLTRNLTTKTSCIAVKKRKVKKIKLQISEVKPKKIEWPFEKLAQIGNNVLKVKRALRSCVLTKPR